MSRLNVRLLLRALEEHIAPAAFTVMNTNDAGAGSLRQAVLDANALTGADSIVFDATTFATAQTIVLTSGQIDVTDPVTITGSGANTLKISGNKSSRILRVQTPIGQPVNLTGITFTDSYTTLFGGAISNFSAALTLTDCIITGNTCAGRGGGIFVYANEPASLTLSRCVVSNNSAVRHVSNDQAFWGWGGGIDIEKPLTNAPGATVSIDSSVISGNSAYSGGGGIEFYQHAGVFTLTNSLVVGNVAKSNGGYAGAIDFYGGPTSVGLIQNSTICNNSSRAVQIYGVGFTPTVQFQNCTIANNAMTGIYVNSANVGVTSSIVTGAVGANGKDIYAISPITLNNSAVGVGSGFTWTGSNNLPFGTDLKLAALASNGGPAQTHRLLPGSPAIDTGSNPASLAFDQRGAGFARNVNGGVDIGAYEVQAAPKVLSLQINDGLVQRSRVTSLTVTFNGPVVLPVNPATAFELKRQSDDSAVAMSASVSGNSITLTFTGGPVEFGSLADGRYTLTAFASLIGNADAQLDGDGNGAGGDDYMLASAATPGSPTNIFRVFGDFDGDGSVAANDFIQFRLAIGGNSPIFDFDNDGAVAAGDFIQFRLRFGGSI